jgi:hypothetical protein
MLEMVDEMLNAHRSLPPLTTLPELVQTRIVDPGEFAGLTGSDNFFHNVNTPDDVKICT